MAYPSTNDVYIFMYVTVLSFSQLTFSLVSQQIWDVRCVGPSCLFVQRLTSDKTK